MLRLLRGKPPIALTIQTDTVAWAVAAAAPTTAAAAAAAAAADRKTPSNALTKRV